MNNIEVRPTVAADLPALTSEPLPFRIKALTAVQDGAIIGIGGIGFTPAGDVVAFAELTPAARTAKVTLHRTARRVLADASAAGIREIVASCEPTFEAGNRWLDRLGFKPAGGRLWIWTCTTSPAKR